jgi:hypothetical protein
MRDVRYSLYVLHTMPEQAAVQGLFLCRTRARKSRSRGSGDLRAGAGASPGSKYGRGMEVRTKLLAGPGAGQGANRGTLFVVGYASTQRWRWKVARARLSWGLIRGAQPTLTEPYEV